MGRLGVRPESAEELLLAIAERPALRLEGVATHLSSAGTDPDFTRHQIALFEGVLDRARELKIRVPRAHAAATAGLFFYPEARKNLVRPGVSLYGIDPGGLAASGFAVEPVLSLKTQIVFLKGVEAGTPIGYGATWRAARATKIATLPCGYDDGYPYALSGKGACVLVNGVRAPVVGTVTMDYLLVDVGAVPGVRVGDTATLVGRDGDEEIRVEELARLAGTIPYTIPCGLGKRVRRVYLAGEHAGEGDGERAREDGDDAPLEPATHGGAEAA
jgi:alanine racemase